MTPLVVAYTALAVALVVWAGGCADRARRRRARWAAVTAWYRGRGPRPEHITGAEVMCLLALDEQAG